MTKYDEVYNELAERTGLNPEIEKELCKRISIIEEQGDIVPSLSRTDWICVMGLIFVVGLLPVFIEAFLLGIE